MFKDTQCRHPSELEANDSPKLPIVQTLDNEINISLRNPDIILYCVFSLNIYEYLNYHQHH